MSNWPSSKARRVLAARMRLGWQVKRQTGSHKALEREAWPDVVFAFHDGDEIGPKMLARLAKHTGLKRRPTPSAEQGRHRASSGSGVRRRLVAWACAIRLLAQSASTTR